MSALPKTPLAAEHSSALNHHVIQLSKLSPLKGLSPLIFDWSVIVAAITVSIMLPSMLVYLAAVILIASRQHALLIVVHDAAHYRLAKDHSLNDLISNAFAAFPNFFCTHMYRINHLKHHRHLNSMQDPDWARKANQSEWTFPQTRFQLMKTFGKILAIGWFKMLLVFAHFSGVLQKESYTTKPGRWLLIQKCAFYSVAAGLIYYLNLGAAFFAYWLVPFLVVLPIIERIRSISEHFGLSYANDFNQTRDILCTPAEAFMFGPHNIRYHLSHHLYPSVPQYNLPQLHERLMQDPEFAKTAHQNDSYFLFGSKSVFSDLTENQEEI